MPGKDGAHAPFGGLSTFEEGSNSLNVIIETPKGHRDKFKPLGRFGPDRAHNLVEEAIKRFEHPRRSKGVGSNRDEK